MAKKESPPANGISREPAQAPMSEEDAWKTLEQLQERNADQRPEEVLAEVTAEVEAARQERYEQRTRAETGRR